jgi:hypothetical protein
MLLVYEVTCVRTSMTQFNSHGFVASFGTGEFDDMLANRDARQDFFGPGAQAQIAVIEIALQTSALFPSSKTTDGEHPAVDAPNVTEITQLGRIGLLAFPADMAGMPFTRKAFIRPNPVADPAVMPAILAALMSARAGFSHRLARLAAFDYDTLGTQERLGDDFLNHGRRRQAPSPGAVAMELTRAAIQGRLKSLAHRDRDRKLFGAASHDYTLNPPAGLAEVEDFERKHHISLPEDYRFFITEIGNGGAGPAYGLFPFAHDDEGLFQEGHLLGDPGEPFPHTEAWNLDNDFYKLCPNPPEGTSEAEEDQLWETWYKFLEAHYWNPSVMNGAIPICHQGCNLRQWLVVHGRQRGYVWNDTRADYAGLAPAKDAEGAQVTFAGWYLAWLGDAERQVTELAAHKGASRFSQPDSRFRKILTALLLIIAGVLFGLMLSMR